MQVKHNIVCHNKSNNINNFHIQAKADYAKFQRLSKNLTKWNNIIAERKCTLKDNNNSATEKNSNTGNNYDAVQTNALLVDII